MVELRDGSIIAQLSGTDMRLPIQYACSYPERWESPLPPLDLTASPLEFHQPDPDRFPCLRLAYRALEAGGSYPVVLNTANEVAVTSFLDGRISFMSIPRIIEQAMDAHSGQGADTLSEIRAVDEWARTYSQKLALGLELKV
jgi:1-deoxy-D-xylulose-5-phosphate reductoisomerase